MTKLNDKTTGGEQSQATQKIVEEKVAKAPEARKPEEEAKELVQLVIFELDKEEYAVEIGEVREILRKPEITPIPNSPDFIEGIINVRGKIVVVMDLEERFNLERESERKSLHVVLTELGDNTFGATVDEVTEVLRIPKTSIEAAPGIISEKIHADYVKGVAVLENRLLIMLDFGKVFEEKGLIELASLVGKQARVARARKMQEKPEEKKETEAEHKAKIEKLVEERMKGAKSTPQAVEPKVDEQKGEAEPAKEDEKTKETKEAEEAEEAEDIVEEPKEKNNQQVIT